MAPNVGQSDIRTGDEVFDDAGINRWGVVTGITPEKIEADWHPASLKGNTERRWVARNGIRKIYRRQQGPVN